MTLEDSMTKRSTFTRSALGGAAALTLATLAAPAPVAAQAPSKVTIVVFGFPSLGAFMPPVIKAKKLDEAHGLDIEFVERPPDAYTTQFNSGEFKVGGSAAVLTVGLADARGVKVKYLFNLFDFWGTIVTSRGEIKSAKDLEGKELDAAASTTNYIMSSFFAKQQGVDMAKRSEEHTSELQSHSDLVCRLLLEKKKNRRECHMIYEKKKQKKLQIH